MDIIRLLGKITGIENSIKWSQSKEIIVLGPDFFGQYSIFVDPKFNVAIFLPKIDKTLLILIGDFFAAKRWIKCNSNGNKVKDEATSKEAFQWNINPKRIWYKGTGFPPDKQVYHGKVLLFKPFTHIIDETWIDIKINGYIKTLKDETKSL